MESVHWKRDIKNWPSCSLHHCDGYYNYVRMSKIAAMLGGQYFLPLVLSLYVIFATGCLYRLYSFYTIALIDDDARQVASH